MTVQQLVERLCQLGNYTLARDLLAAIEAGDRRLINYYLAQAREVLS